MPSTEYVQSDK